MKEENKKSKKKVLLTYLILAACLLVIAAITITVIFTVKRDPELGTNPPEIQQPDNSDNTDTADKDKNDDDNNDDKNDEGDNSNNGDTSDGNEDAPTVSSKGYVIPVKNAVVSTAYEIAHNTTTNQIRVHQGLDFIGTAGDEVYAIADGTVTMIVTNSKIGENYVTITHSDGMTSTYKYIDVLEGLEVGAKIERGELLGAIAVANGYELHEGDHLHLEINVQGKNVDPNIYLDLIEK